MGNLTSNSVNPVNYDCPKCMEKDKRRIPNLAGKFFIINETECKCNGCNTVYPKSQFYKIVVNDVRPEENVKYN